MIIKLKKIILPAPADNTTLAHMPFGKQPGFIADINDCDWLFRQ